MILTKTIENIKSDFKYLYESKLYKVWTIGFSDGGYIYIPEEFAKLCHVKQEVEFDIKLGL
jgi:hypothetical protein